MDNKFSYSNFFLAWDRPKKFGAQPAFYNFNCKRDVLVDVENPQNTSITLQPNETRTIFDGSRTLTVDATTVLSLAYSVLGNHKYRLSYVSGTLPGFRTNRGVVISAVSMAMVINSNSTATLTAGVAGTFSGVVATDTLFIPGVTTGDASIGFNSLNEGYWYVLGATGTVLTLTRVMGTIFNGYTETIVPTGNALVYGASGVIVGDTLELVSGFSASNCRDYTVTAVTSEFVEFSSTIPLMAETVTPTASGLVVYSDGKRFVRVESDQEVVVRVNADTSNNIRIVPWDPTNSKMVGEFMCTGPVWGLVLWNKSTGVAKINIISVE
jgi:hypothetical protein